MAAGRNISVLFLATTLVLVGALVPAAATAGTCVDKCYKECEKGSKECTETCDAVCRLQAASTPKEFATAPPDVKAILEETFEQEAADAAHSSVAASTPGITKLKDGCIRECKNEPCVGPSRKGDPACTTPTGCQDVCRVDALGLAFSAMTYGQTSADEKEAVVQAIKKHASGPNDKFGKLELSCIGKWGKKCDNDQACVALCDNGCRAKSVVGAFFLAKTQEKEAIKKDVQAAIGRSSNLLVAKSKFI